MFLLTRAYGSENEIVSFCHNRIRPNCGGEQTIRVRFKACRSFSLDTSPFIASPRVADLPRMDLATSKIRFFFSFVGRDYLFAFALSLLAIQPNIVQFSSFLWKQFPPCHAEATRLVCLHLSALCVLLGRPAPPPPQPERSLPAKSAWGAPASVLLPQPRDSTQSGGEGAARPRGARLWVLSIAVILAWRLRSPAKRRCLHSVCTCEDMCQCTERTLPTPTVREIRYVVVS